MGGGGGGGGGLKVVAEHRGLKIPKRARNSLVTSQMVYK